MYRAYCSARVACFSVAVRQLERVGRTFMLHLYGILHSVLVQSNTCPVLLFSCLWGFRCMFPPVQSLEPTESKLPLACHARAGHLAVFLYGLVYVRLRVSAQNFGTIPGEFCVTAQVTNSTQVDALCIVFLP